MRKVLFILGQLTDEDVAWIARAGRRLDAPAGHSLIRMGTVVDDLIIVLDGQADVTVGGKRLARVGRGDLLGEMSLVEQGMPSADVVTVGPATLLLVPIVAIRDKLAADAPFAARFYKAIALFLSQRMRGTIELLGYGEKTTALEDEQELDGEVMDGLHMAGMRFLRIFERIAGSGAGPNPG
jgi:CRP-like cAMP-binding protein